MNIRARSTFRAGSWSRFESQLVPRLMAAGRAAASVVLDHSQALVPRRTGELADSGAIATRWVGSHVQALVIYYALHAAFVEFGTGNRGRGTYPYPLPQQGVPITDRWIYDYKQQNWVGMPSHPYIRPALDTGREPALDAFRRVASSR